MNERIKELANQAYEYALAESKGGTNICAPGSDYFLAMEKAKFAELIVRECAQLARDTDLEDIEGGDSEVLRAAKRQILEHFGVE
jgi:hypothetical protein